MPSFDEGLTDNIEKQLHLAQEKQEMISERLRLFYVALTRAKELAILVANPPSNETFINEIKSDELVDESIRNNFNSFNQLLYSVIGHYAQKRRKAPYDAVIYNEDYKARLPKERRTLERKPVFTYKELNYQPKQIKKERYSRHSVDIKDKQTLKDIALGTLIHEQLERLDFSFPLRDQIDNLDVDDQVKTFLYQIEALPFLRDLKDAYVYQEYEFIVSKDDQVKQGMIDLLIETPAALLVVDYKLKDIHKPAYITQLEGYKDYLRTKSDKPIHAYLYSLIDGIYEEV
jgi:ATP-dependent exoDNAse (exonuclease V) beta subunit